MLKHGFGAKHIRINFRVLLNDRKVWDHHDHSTELALAMGGVFQREPHRAKRFSPAGGHAKGEHPGRLFGGVAAMLLYLRTHVQHGRGSSPFPRRICHSVQVNIHLLEPMLRMQFLLNE